MNEPIAVLGRDELVRNLSKFSEGLVDKVVTAVEITQAEVADEVRRNHPFTTRTGQLEQSLQPGRVELSNDRVEGEVIADKAYASFVEFGTSRSRPFPFLYPALVSRAQAFKNRIAYVMKTYGGL